MAKMRVVDEEIELEEKINKLVSFMQSPNFPKLSEEAQFLLNVQLGAMVLYNDTLIRRLKIWQD